MQYLIWYRMCEQSCSESLLNARLHDATKTCDHASKSHYVNGLIETCDCRKKVGRFQLSCDSMQLWNDLDQFC